MGGTVSQPAGMLAWNPESPWRLWPDVMAADLPTAPPADAPDKGGCKERLKQAQKRLKKEHDKLYASKTHAVLAIFQAYDAAGKDGTIRRVAYRLDPAAVEVNAFKAPTELERQHDFLWRCARVLPPKGKLGFFNRSYYEEVLTVRVNPGFLQGQYPHQELDLTALWQERFDAINAFERHLVTSGTRVLKFWLNVSRDEQRQRFLDRLNEPEKQWKFNPNDLRVARQRSEHDQALTHMLNATSTAHAPWFVIPADHKPYMRWQCTQLVADAMEALRLEYPPVDSETRENTDRFRQQLETD